MKIKKGDTVKILLGKDKGKSGKVELILAKENQLVVAGINVYKKHIKRQSKDQPGGIVELNRPLAVSKVALICPKCKKATRVGWQITEKGKKRLCKKCGKTI